MVWTERTLGMGYMLISAAVLIGWVARVPELVIHGPSTMMPGTAEGVFFLGVGLILPRTRGAIALGFLVLGASVMISYAFGVGHPLDSWPIRPWTSWGTPIPGRMAPSTAASFVLVAALRFLPSARNAVCTLGILASMPPLLGAVFPFGRHTEAVVASLMSPVTAAVFVSFWLWALWRITR